MLRDVGSRLRSPDSLRSKASRGRIQIRRAASAKTAFAQALPQEVIDVLNFALTLDYLDNDYYIMGLDALGSAAAAQPEFDFTADGAFDPLGDYPTFRLLSHAFEDTGVFQVGAF